ncbi:M1 family metallopeptidase [Mucilaginibacter sp. SP1R1]|uniref:M1 family metallopeptidase n=1 Tax=Mucilaginibacter sp. SP1R1 TaxID=2723091 RepID=UPI00160E7506|nr:M1 family metallopeptidase [Mucilaginibacter sp. SP1R1]MBB6147805.1 rRNA processing protein Gar1 [Mucilaginibacter sp. SP1R1]
MLNLKKLLTIVLLCGSTLTYAQVTLPIATNLQKTYTQGTRTTGGAPGKNYWQNTADYRIKVNFNPKNLNLTGTVSIDYTNNSPDTLNTVQFKLYPNLYKKGVIRDMPVLAQDLTNGVQIQSISMNNQLQDTAKRKIDGTNMILKVTPIAPKQHVHFDIAYAYTLNQTSHIRTGQIDPGAFFIAYFFPRIAVYDDIDGWNEYPYLGSQEFYNDFCHFNAEITVPGNYMVWATGNIKNTNEVYQPKYAKLIADAGTSDQVTDIITPADLQAGNITQNNNTNTWKFEADSVTDLVFALSNHYIWKASSMVVDPQTKRRTRVDAVFNPVHKDYFEVVNYARKTVETMSYQFPKWPYPYPHETVFDGLDQMEYPMMVNDNPLENTADAIELTDHEIFHTMFPFYMGTNETKYGWMDEGWATIAEWLISPVIDPTIVDTYGVGPTENSAGIEQDAPIMTLTPQLTGIAKFTDSYPKPALAYLYVKDMLGDELFTKALHYYIGQWHGKHPMPYDFFNCINTGSGVNLNWFWKSWFFDNGVPNLAISKVSNLQQKYTVTITSIGTKPVPINLMVYYADGSKQLVHQSIACWAKGNKTTTVAFTGKKKVVHMVLGTTYDPDVDKRDNTWRPKATERTANLGYLKTD